MIITNVRNPTEHLYFFIQKNFIGISKKVFLHIEMKKGMFCKNFGLLLEFVMTIIFSKFFYYFLIQKNGDSGIKNDNFLI